VAESVKHILHGLTGRLLLHPFQQWLLWCRASGAKRLTKRIPLVLWRMYPVKGSFIRAQF